MLVSGSNTIAYAICGASPTTANCWAVGNYVFKGCDATSNSCSIAQTLQINPPTPTSGCTFNGGSALSSGATTNSLLASAPLACTISTIGGQVVGTLTYNGVNSGTSNTVVSFTTTWDDSQNPFTWNSPATANYLTTNVQWYNKLSSLHNNKYSRHQVLISMKRIPSITTTNSTYLKHLQQLTSHLRKTTSQ